MLIENALSDAVRFFHIDALSSAVGLKIDFDMALLVIASGFYRILAKTMRGYSDAQARQIFCDLVDISADVTITEHEVQVSFHRRSHLRLWAARKTCRYSLVEWVEAAVDHLQRANALNLRSISVVEM
jgi:hypothetical protein